MRKCTINVIRMEKTREIPEKYVAIKEEMEDLRSSVTPLVACRMGRNPTWAVY